MRKPLSLRPYGVLATALLLSACAVGDDYARPGFAFPQQWPWEQSAEQKQASETAKRIPQDWWNAFNDPALTALIEEGHQYNSNLLIAAARVAEARATLGVSDSYLYPELNVEGAARRTSNSNMNNMSGFALSSKPFNNFSLGAVLNYELDLWGRLRRGSEAAGARLLSTEANRDAVRLALSSDIASGYFNLLALDAQIRVTEDTIVARDEAYKYESAQYNRGMVNELTYRQSESELAAARAALPALVQTRREQESALAILLGRSPQQIVEGKVTRGDSIDSLPVPPSLPAELPSTLLERRPDVYAAEQALVANNADIGVAKAAYFPTISLSALLGLASSEADDLLQGSARQWNTGATLAGPLLNAGRVGYGVDAARARKDEAEVNYQQAVRIAFKDVIDALSAEHTSAERVDALTLQTGSLSEALRVASLRYDAGYSTYLDKLDAQRNLYQVQLNRITAQRDRLTTSVNLYKALGGGWAINGQTEEEVKPVEEAAPIAAPEADVTETSTPETEEQAAP